MLACCSLQLFAKPARPGFFPYTQPDGTTVLIQRHGDEWGHWTTNSQGQVVRRDAEGFYRVVEGMDVALAKNLASVRQKARRQLMNAERSAAPIATGQKHFLLVLVEFSDLSFKIDNPRQAIQDMLNQEGYSQNGATGSARDYYYENSHGSFEPVFDVFGPVKLGKKMSYYGENDDQGSDDKAHEAVRDACKKLDDSVNFADYDLDGDGKVDLVYMIYAGKGEADGGSEDSIWPHQWYLYSGGGISLVLDGKRIDRYACGPELDGRGKLDGIGTICHEFGHAMGMPDFYDTDYSTNGTCRTLGSYSLMDSGCYNNSGWTPPYLNFEERMCLGWLTESDLPTLSANGEYSLAPINENEAYKSLTDMEGEYFLYESRGSGKWDKHVPAAGLVVYHVDKSSRMVKIMAGESYTYSVSAADLWSKWEQSNAINENGSHPCFYIVASGAPEDIMYGMTYSATYGYYFNSTYYASLPFPGSKQVTQFQAVSWNGVESDGYLTDIAYAAGRVSFRLRGLGANKLDYPLIYNPGKGKYSAGDAFALRLELPDNYPVESVQWSLDGNPVSRESVTLSAGAHIIEAEVLNGEGKKAIITLEVVAE